MPISDILNAYKPIYGDLKNLKFSFAFRDIIYRVETREKKKTFGELNSDKTFYVIRSIDDKSKYYIGPVHNLLANYFYVMSHLFYAEEKGYIPIVDQKNYPVYNKQDGLVNGTDNAWEYFWQQPCVYTLEEVYKSKNVVLSKQSWRGTWNWGYSIENHKNIALINDFHRMTQKIPFNSITQETIDNRVNSVLPHDSRIVGINYRFNGYDKKSPEIGAGHPAQPEIESLIKIARHYLQELGFDYIFLASDEKRIIDIFKSQLGEKILYLDRNRVDRLVHYDGLADMYSDSEILKTSMDYLAEMTILSKCNVLVGSITSGLRYAIVMNNGAYEDTVLFDNGLISDQRMKNKGIV